MRIVVVRHGHAEPKRGWAGLDVDRPLVDRAAAELCEALVVSEPADSVVVLCTHREVLVQLLPWLSKQFGRNLGHRLPGAKGGAWFLCFRGPDLLTVEYRAPRA